MRFMKFERSRVLWTVAFLSVIGGALASVVTEDSQAEAQEHAEKKPEAAQHEPDAKPNDKASEKSVAEADSKHETWEASSSGCITDASAIEDVKKRREELATKQKDLIARETELKARETALTEEIKKLEAIREELSGISAVKKKEHEERVAKIVETLESMSPKAASQLLGTLDEKLAVASMAQIGTAKLAKIMNLMEPAKASRLTEILAGVARAKSAARNEQRAVAAEVATVATIQSSKGGDNDYGHNEQSASRSGLQAERTESVSRQGQVSDR